MMHTTLYSLAKSTFLAGLILATVISCTGDPDGMSVEVCGDIAVPDELEAIRIHLLNEEREILHSGVRDLLICPEDRIRPLPQTVNFREIDESVALVEIIALYEGVAITSTERRVESFGDFRVSLSESCRGSQCSLGQTCIVDSCEFTPTGSDETCRESVTSVPDAGTDAGDVATGSDPPTDVDDADAGDTDTGPPAEEPRYCPPDDDS